MRRVPVVVAALWAVAALLAASCIVGSMSVGLFYMPAAIALAIAARSPVEHRRPTG